METDKLFFEEKGAELLKNIGMTKAEFARRMCIHKQNVNLLFKTKNIMVLRKAAEVLGVSFELLVSHTQPMDYESCTFFEDYAKKGDLNKAKELLEAINEANLTKEERDWLRKNI
ncbi:MAG: helix-turn-helix transcriptional regulator [Bacteroidales bacterium]|nr:helix-turn-helix transcriptional regulator [Bacteroidales bacterium]